MSVKEIYIYGCIAIFVLTFIRLARNPSSDALITVLVAGVLASVWFLWTPLLLVTFIHNFIKKIGR